jgi:hypothetical protein
MGRPVLPSNVEGTRPSGGQSRPERKPGEAGLRGGGLMRRGDAKPRRAARLTTSANRQLLERVGCARARLARSAVPHPE